MRFRSMTERRAKIVPGSDPATLAALQWAYSAAEAVVEELWGSGESYHAVGAQVVANRISDRIVALTHPEEG